MRIFLFSIAVLVTVITPGTCQFTFDHFEEEVLAYTPERSSGVPEKALEFAEMVLNETRSATKGDPRAFNVADYMNVLSVFGSLQRPREDMLLAFRKLCSAKDHCTYLKAFRQKVMDNEKYLPVRDAWLDALETCTSDLTKAEDELSPVAYAKKYQLDIELIVALAKIRQADQAVRKEQGLSGPDQRRLADGKNQQRIDSLFQEYGTYLGKTLAGKRYQSTMWLVIQHAPLTYMEKYLPIVHQAYLQDEISATPFKMLLDRYHGLKFGYQVFGSQSGFGFRIADEATRERVKREYGVL